MKTNTELVKKIHYEFNNEVNLLLAEAKNTIKHNNDYWSKVDKLKESGFVNVNEVQLAEKEKKINDEKQFMANAIEYFISKVYLLMVILNGSRSET